MTLRPAIDFSIPGEGEARLVLHMGDEWVDVTLDVERRRVQHVAIRSAEEGYVDNDGSSLRLTLQNVYFEIAWYRIEDLYQRGVEEIQAAEVGDD